MLLYWMLDADGASLVVMRRISHWGKRSLSEVSRATWGGAPPRGRLELRPVGRCFPRDWRIDWRAILHGHRLVVHGWVDATAP